MQELIENISQKALEFKNTFGTFFHIPYFCIPKSKKGLVWVMV